jgi:tyrosyl-tRNA synthetase
MTTTSIDLARAAGVNPLEYLGSRGFVQDVTDADGLTRLFADQPVTAYVGFDPTGSSLHVGHLLPIMMLASLQRLGHRPLAITGGGTALIGDPSGKSRSRPMLTEEEISANLVSIQAQLARFIDLDDDAADGHQCGRLLNNAGWLLPLHHIAFLRDIGRYFSVNEMLASKSYEERLKTTGLSFVEFSYRLLQAFDFLHLFRTEHCMLQMGGSDQWGNILAGVNLVRCVEGAEVFGLTSPLLTTSSGTKMGKTESGAVWLDPARTSPFDFHQYWVNVEDADVARFLRIYTFLPDEEIVDLTSVSGKALRTAKRALAREATAIAHGRDIALEVEESARALFGGGIPREGTGNGHIPTVQIRMLDLPAAITVADLFLLSGLCTSRREARRLAVQGGLSIDGCRVDDPDAAHPVHPGMVELRLGKKRVCQMEVA